MSFEAGPFNCPAGSHVREARSPEVERQISDNMKLYCRCSFGQGATTSILRPTGPAVGSRHPRGSHVTVLAVAFGNGAARATRSCCVWAFGGEGVRLTSVRSSSLLTLRQMPNPLFLLVNALTEIATACLCSPSFTL